MGGLNGRLDTAKTRISELGERSRTWIQNAFQRDMERENMNEVKRYEGWNESVRYRDNQNPGSLTVQYVYPVDTCISTLGTYAPIITGNGANVCKR